MTRLPEKHILDGPVRKLQEKTRVLNAMLGKMEANLAFPQLVFFSYVALVCFQLSMLFFKVFSERTTICKYWLSRVKYPRAYHQRSLCCCYRGDGMDESDPESGQEQRSRGRSVGDDKGMMKWMQMKIRGGNKGG